MVMSWAKLSSTGWPRGNRRRSTTDRPFSVVGADRERLGRSRQLLVLVGWALDIETLKTVLPGMVAMNPGGTAVGFLLAAPRCGCW